MNELIDNIGPLVYPLAIFSFLAIIFIIERMIFFIRLPKFETSEQYTKLLKELRNNEHLSKPIRDELISHRLLDVKESLEFGIRFLRIIAVLSPMLGLLGTVLGMIESFKIIATQQGPVVPATIADGLWIAMLTTAYGLSIALPCLFAAFIFSRISEKRLLAFQKSLNSESLKLEGAKLE